MVKLGANLGLLGFAAFLRRAAAPWPAVAALDSRESVPSAADRRTTSGGRRTRLLFQAYFSEADRCIDLSAGHRRSPHTSAAVAVRRLTPDFQTLRFGSLFRLNYARFSQNASKYQNRQNMQILDM